MGGGLRRLSGSGQGGGDWALGEGGTAQLLVQT